MSVDYVIRLEQGRSLRPSAIVVDAFAHALRLNREETSTLYRAAGLAPPSRIVVRELGDGLQRFLTCVSGVAAAVYSADWWLLGWNHLWSELLGDPSGYTGYGCNLAWQVFTYEDWRPVPRDRTLNQFRQSLANDLRTELIEYPDDMRLAKLIEALTEVSEDFAQAWASSTAGRQPSERKTLRHPQAGNLWLHTDVFQLRGDDQHLVLYSADPDSRAAVALEHLG